MLGEGTPDQKPHESSCTDKLLQLEEAIEKLLEMLKDKQQRTVNNNTRGLARKIKIALKSFKSAMSKEQANKVPVLTNPRARELSDVRKELYFAPVGKPLLNSTGSTRKRKAGSSPSTEAPRSNKRANQKKMVPSIEQHQESPKQRGTAPPRARQQKPARDQRDERESEDSQAWKKVQKKKKGSQEESGEGTKTTVFAKCTSGKC
ncbi:hypothetical protein KM043_013988 [Ampulex compressa]|nr:hypothetical protein KM043_013988 [Ampulex compressa]